MIKNQANMAAYYIIFQGHRIDLAENNRLYLSAVHPILNSYVLINKFWWPIIILSESIKIINNRDWQRNLRNAQDTQYPSVGFPFKRYFPFLPSLYTISYYINSGVSTIKRIWYYSNVVNIRYILCTMLLNAIIYKEV